MSPTIIKKEEQYILKTDSEEVSNSTSLNKALMCFVASFYVFNLSYPKPCKKFLTFIQRIFLKIADGEKVDKSVLLLNEKIHNQMMVEI